MSHPDARVRRIRRELPLQEATLHGQRVGFRMAGEGPLVVLIHGITSRSDVWLEVMEDLASDHTVVAPDLIGHGRSAKPRGDYSLGAYASGGRDLLGLLGFERGTVVGHSLGGGIALQFAYQFPEYTERLALVSSGGLGREVNPILRAASLPGAGLVLPPITRDWAISAGSALAGDAERTADLLQRQRLMAAQPVAQLDHLALALGQCVERPLDVLTLKVL